MLKIKTFTFNPLQENTYIVFSDKKNAFVIDPGMCDAAERKEFDDFISKNELSLLFILNTHCHVDHVLGNEHVKFKYKVPLWIGTLEEAGLRAVKNYAPVYGFSNYQESEPDRLLEDTDVIKLDEEEFTILFVPGHSAGHLAFYNFKHDICFSGDVIFRQSIGRTDLPGGHHQTLLKSIKEKIFTLPEETKLFSGHGPSTNVGFEKSNNPFFR